MREIVLKRFLKILSPYVGLAKHIGGLDYLNGDPVYYSLGAMNCDISVLVGEAGRFRANLRSSGGGADIYEALFSTLGELIERYSSSFYDKRELVFGSYRKLSNNSVNIREISLFHEMQYKSDNFPFVPLEEDLEIYWTYCYDIIHGNYKLYPARLIYMPFREKEPPIGFTTSNGLSAHTNFYRAVLNGMYEIIERDAFMIAWAGHLDLPKIKINKELKKYINNIFYDNYEFHIFDITTDIGIPSLWGICKGKSDFGEFIVSTTATRGTYTLAIKKLLREFGQVGMYVRALIQERRKNEWNPKFEDLKTFDDCMAFYNIKTEYIEPAFGKYLNKDPDLDIEFIPDEKEITDKNSILEEIARIKKIFKSKNYDLLVKDITNYDVRELGFYVVRVISPQLVPIHAEYKYPLLGSKRIYERTGKTFNELNPYPYPFP